MKCLKCGKSSASPFCLACSAGKLPNDVYALWRLDESYLLHDEDSVKKKHADPVPKKTSTEAKAHSVTTDESKKVVSNNPEKNPVDSLNASKQSTDHPASKDKNYYSGNSDYLYQNYLEEVKRYNEKKKKKEAVSQKNLTNKAEDKSDAAQPTSKKESQTPAVTVSESKQSQPKQNIPQIDVYANDYSTVEAEKAVQQAKKYVDKASLVDVASTQYRSSNMSYRSSHHSAAIICSIIAVGFETAIVIIALTTGLFTLAINTSFGTYIVLQVFLLVNTLIGIGLGRIGHISFPGYLAAIISIVATWASFVMSVFFGGSGGLSFLEGIFTGILAFFFFGAVSSGVSYLCGAMLSWLNK